MIHVTSGSALAVEIGLAIFCFIDVLLAPEPAARWIPRWGWVLSVLTFPALGCVLWLVAGRTWRSRVRALGRRTGSAGSVATSGDAGRDAVADGTPDTTGVLTPASGPDPSRRSAAEIMAELTGAGEPIQFSLDQLEPDTVPDGPISPWPRDPGLAGQVWDLNEEHERTLRLWEADLFRREAALRAAQRQDAA